MKLSNAVTKNQRFSYIVLAKFGAQQIKCFTREEAQQAIDELLSSGELCELLDFKTYQKHRIKNKLVYDRFTI